VATAGGAGSDAPEVRLRRVVGDLDAAWEYRTLALGAPADGDWQTLSQAMATAPAWHGELAARVGDRRAAAAYLAGWLVEVPVLLVGLPVVAGAPVPRVTPHDLYVRRHADGWLDGLAIAPRAVDDRGDLLAVAAEHVHDLTAPVVAVLTEVLPVGPAAAWGAVADGLAAQALHLDRVRGADTDRTWTRLERLLDGLQARLPRRLVRPRPLLVSWSGGTARYPVRGTCCLYHRTCEAPDRDGEGYCATCPLRTPESQRRRLREHLEVARG